MDTDLDTGLYTGGDTGADEAPTRSGQAYLWLKRGLLSGRFPLGVRMAEERLAREVQVSRTPVREALSRLHVEGLVERHPEGGYSPALPDLDAIAELYEVRASLEQSALGRGAGRFDLDRLRTLRDDWAGIAEEFDGAEPDPSFVLIDEDFHLRLAAAAGNQSLVSILAGVNERIRVVRMHDFLTAERVEATIAQHLGIVDAALSGDPTIASGLLAAHLSESLAVAEGRAADAIARMIRSSRGAR